MTTLADILQRLARRRLTLVPIAHIRCEKRKAGLDEGWGGEPIAAFPPYAFFHQFNSGQEKAAVEAMESWYYRRLVVDRLVRMPKREGGMAGGSLFRAINRIHAKAGIVLQVDMSNADEELSRQAISQRVAQRFSLFRSIKQHGQCLTWDYIRMVPERNCFTLVDGHHRVAAMAVCGHTEIQASVAESFLLRRLRGVCIRLSR